MLNPMPHQPVNFFPLSWQGISPILLASAAKRQVRFLPVLINLLYPAIPSIVDQALLSPVPNFSFHTALQAPDVYWPM